MVLSLASLLHRLPLFSQLAILGGNHHCLEAARILSSSVEYLSTHLYSSSIVTGGSSDSD